MHENYAARAHPEYVVLDIGDRFGALIVYTDAELHGMEVEISPAGDDSDRSHKDVLERGIGAGVAFTAVFDRLPEGEYTLWTQGHARARRVRVSGGGVAELDWRTAGQASAA